MYRRQKRRTDCSPTQTAPSLMTAMEAKVFLPADIVIGLGRRVP